MRLNLGELQAHVKRTLDEERSIEALKGEINRVLGPVVVTEGRLEDVVAEANDRIDVLHRTGRDGMFDFLPTVTTGFLDHNHPEVRRFAARVVPEKFLGKLTGDRDSAVRAAVAQRVPLPVVREMMKRFRNDDQLRVIYRTRKQKGKLNEAGIAKPEVEPMGTDPVDGAERMGDAARTAEGPELDDPWYDQLARQFLHTYGRNIEDAWMELAVSRFCRSSHTTSFVDVDEDKLMKVVQALLKDRDDLAMERDALKETLAWLDEQVKLDEQVMPEFHEVIDPVRTLIESDLTHEQYVAKASSVFRVQEATLPSAIRKHRLGEGNARVVNVPIIGWLPHGSTFRAIDERALDRFCEAWNQHQAIGGEPLILAWSPHPCDVSKVSFNVRLS